LYVIMCISISIIDESVHSFSVVCIHGNQHVQIFFTIVAFLRYSFIKYFLCTHSSWVLFMPVSIVYSVCIWLFLWICFLYIHKLFHMFLYFHKLFCSFLSYYHFHYGRMVTHQKMVCFISRRIHRRISI